MLFTYITAGKIQEKRLKGENMNEQQKFLTIFLDSINKLYNDIYAWLQSTKLKLSKEQYEIFEDFSGPYQVNILNILDEKNDLLASLKPVSAKVIAAHGRVDLIGDIDKLIFLHYQQDKSEINQIDGVSIFYKGMEKTGWYWADDSRRQKAHLLNKEFFLELLTEVSDYEF